MPKSPELTHNNRFQRRNALALATALAFATTGLFAISTNANSEPATQKPSRVIAGQMDPDEAVRLERLKARWASRPKTQSDSRPHAGNTWTVTSCADNGSAGTLRHAIENLAQDGDIVDLSGVGNCSITLQSSLVTSIDNLTIVGNSKYGLSGYGISGNNQHRIIDHQGTGTLTLDRVIIKNGMVAQDAISSVSGGCIRSNGNVTLKNQSVAKYCVAKNVGYGEASGGAIKAAGEVTIDTSTVRHSKAISTHSQYGGAFGGAIDTFDRITLSAASIRKNQAESPNIVSGGALFAGSGFSAKYSEFIENSAVITGTDAPQNEAGGGAVWITGSGTSSIKYSTFSENVAGYGAAMVLGSSSNPSTATAIQHVTIANNHSLASRAGAAGAINVRHKTQILNSTISGNTEDNADGNKYGAGIHVREDVDLKLSSTIVAGNTSVQEGELGDGSDIFGSNLSNPVTVTGENNLVQLSLGVSLPPGTLTLDPKLLPLADNGGVTLTMALSPDSPAVDTGKSNGLQVDQRGSGYTRAWGAAADIGAFELQPLADAIFVDDFE